MDDLNDGGLQHTDAKETFSPDIPRSDLRSERRIAAVSSPALSAARLTLPGVMDAEGRVDESRLRMYIFKNGGVCPSERGFVWRFLFGMYPCSSTVLERFLLQEQMVVRYQVMKRKWQQFLPPAVRMHLNGTDAELVAAVRYFDQRQAQAQQQTTEESEEVRDRVAFLELQAQILFERVTFDQEELREATRIIDKDVPRTNRDLRYYQQEGLGNLLVLRDILITYAAFHPEVSYAQGMNDLCSRFLEVLDSEVDTFWSFSCYMEKFSKDFRADGLHRKIGEHSESQLQAINTDFTFELFICAAILLENRESLLRCRDDVQLIQFTSSLQGTLDLNSTLKKAEHHLYNYCKRCAWDYMTGCCRADSSTEEDFLYQLRSLLVLK
ncbi:TBC1 domain family member 25 isoform X2 [Eleginops maclovinus]|uniref:TBC1 domain family member 25 isoform X2 n=1 Tax=Eleginops maclovinus TaxID=56733 RepID=UPI0030805342